jgi:two-component system sensor histidine kinase BaeS
MSSLRGRLAIVLAGLAVVAVAAVTAIVATATFSTFQKTLSERRNSEWAITQRLEAAAVAGDATNERSVIKGLSQKYDARIVLTDVDKRVLVDTGSGRLPPLVATVYAYEYDAAGKIVDKQPRLVFVGLSAAPSIPWPLIVLVAAPIAGAAAAVAIPLSGFVTRPLRQLSSAAQSIREGELDARVDVTTPREVADLAASFNLMAEELARADVRRRQVTADIAHELRSPLTNILSHLDAIADGVIEPAPDQLQIITFEAVRLARLVDDLQTLAALDEHALTLRAAPTDLCRLLDVAIEARRARTLAGELSVTRDGTCRSPVSLDAVRFDQAFGNLLDNALAHTPRGGHIDVLLSDCGDEIEIAVADSGPGIPPDFLPRVFDRLSRADPSRSEGAHGRGLGLAIARGLVRAQGGDITVGNSEAGGARFVIALPRRADVAVSDAVRDS